MKSRLVFTKLLSGRLVPALGILLVVFFLAGCQYWFQDMKGYLEYWTGTVQVSGVQWFSTPESQKDDNGADTIPTNAEISFHASIENPDGYDLDVGIGREQDNLRSIRIAGESGALVLPLATVEDSTATSISLAIDSISSVTTLASLALEHTDFTVTFVPTRTDSGQGTPTARTLTLRYNTPPRMPLEVAWSAGEGKLSWLGAEHSKGWEMVQGVDQSLDNHIYWAWPKGITDPTNPDSVARFQVYVDGVLSQEGNPHQFEYNDYSQVSPKLADYQVYRVAVSSGTRVEVYALDVEGVRSLGTGSGIAPHKTTLDASGGFFASSGTSGVELYKAHGSRASGGDLETPYYDGHYLSGWSTSAGGNPVTFPYSIEAPVTLYALWTAYPASGGDVGGDVPDGGASGGKPPVTTYAITYNGNGATSGTEPAGQTKLVGKSVALAANSGGLVRSGYTFAGWNTQADGQGTGYAEGSSYNADASVTLYAWWRKMDYTITYELDGGTASNPQGYSVEDLPLSLNTPSKRGYTFDGWFKDGQRVTKIAEGTTGNLTLQAKWTANQYAVQFVGNGGSGSMSTQTFTYDQSQNLTVNTFTRTGYTFAGWQGSDDKSYTDGQSVKNLTAEQNGNVTLTAQWTANTYTVTLDDKDGAGGSGNVTVTYDQPPPSVKVPTKTGYTFGGYYTGTDGNGTKYYDASGNGVNPWKEAKDTTLTAQWTANTYIVTLDDKDGAGGSGNVTVTYDQSPPSVKVPTKTGYTFGGYFEKRNGTGMQYYDYKGNGLLSWTKITDITLYAKWTYEEPKTGSDGKYEVANHGNLLWIGQELSAGRITNFDLKLTADIVVPSGEWVTMYLPDGESNASTFDGQGYSITINGTFSGGDLGDGVLFGRFNYSTIKNLVLKGDVSVAASSRYVGAVVGQAYCTIIQNVESRMNITNAGTNHTGGLVGLFGGKDKAKIENCAVFSNVSGKGSTGGLIGRMWSNTQTCTVTNSVYMGQVSGTSMGVIAGSNGNGSTSESTLTNILYCCKTSGITAVGGSSDSSSKTNVVSKTEDEIKSEALKILGSSWELGSDGLPTLKKNP